MDRYTRQLKRSSSAGRRHYRNRNEPAALSIRRCNVFPVSESTKVEMVSAATGPDKTGPAARKMTLRWSAATTGQDRVRSNE
mmetsp:Transcript_10702/g.21990  ORF Transcript_10702/g.21990 Transcript_10702/m.21990 type:complete len:82 (+) Transcript_10702:300-545(+)